MGKKKVKNRYDVQVGDIFSKNSENSSYSIFLQVVALHGETKVDVRELRQRCIEFDGHYKGNVNSVWFLRMFLGISGLNWTEPKHICIWNCTKTMIVLFIFGTIVLKLQNSLT